MMMQPHQVLTPKIFDTIIRDEIERCFKIKYLTDGSLPDFYKEVSERKQKDEVYSIFFKSLDDILDGIGIRKEKLEIRLYWEREDDEYEDRDMKLKKFRIICLYFYYKGKKYVMRLDDRIETIRAYLFTKNYFKPALEASRGLRYKTIEERRHDGRIEFDTYNLVKVTGSHISRELKSYEKKIWQPELFLDNKDTILIGL